MWKKAEKAFFQFTHALYDFVLYFLIIIFVLDGKNPATAFGSEVFMPERHVRRRDGRTRGG